jgi:hypothetical protein
MSTPSNDPQKPLTEQDVDAWLRAAKERRVQLHVQAMAPWNSFSRQEAFTEMSNLLEEAFEEVRVMSESTREWSQGVRGEATDLRTHAAQLMERGITLMARMAQFAPPSPEALHKAESRMLEMFKGGPRQGDSS